MKLYKNKKIFLILILSIASLTLILLFVLERTNKTNFFGNNAVLTENGETTSSAETAQSNYTDGNIREPGNTLNESKGSATLIANPVQSDNHSNPIVSKTGDITLYSPKSNAIVGSEFSISGSSNLSMVSYRVIDDISGVIGSGELTVTNGKFGGMINLQTNASSGRLDFFGTRQDGTEFSNLEVAVRFK